MRRLAAIAALSLGALLLTPVQHADASERCVTHAEYKKVHKSMTKARVHRIFDSAGKQYWAEGRYEIRVYTPCTDRRFGWVHVNYKEGRVVAKSVNWG